MGKPDYILLVDDDKMVNFLNKALLEKAQIAKEVLVAKNGEEAFAVIHELEARSSKNEELCILLDLNMPLLDGYEFLDELKRGKVDLKVKVYILSILSELREKKHLKDYPIAGYIGKPLALQDIEQILSGDKPVYFDKAW